jgi:hypothetical protein
LRELSNHEGIAMNTHDLVDAIVGAGAHGGSDRLFAILNPIVERWKAQQHTTLQRMLEDLDQLQAPDREFAVRCNGVRSDFLLFVEGSTEVTCQEVWQVLKAAHIPHRRIGSQQGIFEISLKEDAIKAAAIINAVGLRAKALKRTGGKIYHDWAPNGAQETEEVL